MGWGSLQNGQTIGRCCRGHGSRRIVALPIIAILAIASALMFRTWPFFVQERVGRHGKRFRMLKLRTMPRWAPAHVDKFEIQAVRLPAFAQMLRNTHLDEFPQLLLVPLGRMSLVGPRPEMVFLHDLGDPEFAGARTSVRPGCTGIWQVSQASGGLIWDAPEYDLFYVKHACLRLDLWILGQTLIGMIPRSTKVSLDDVPRWAFCFPRLATTDKAGLAPERGGCHSPEGDLTTVTPKERPPPPAGK